MVDIFISYRRADTRELVGRLSDHLRATFGSESVFLDTSSIPVGTAFPGYIRDALNSARLMLVIIGGHWATVVNDAGDRRLDDPRDFVRVELEMALAADIAVVPVLVAGAAMPSKEELPESLAALADKQAAVIGSDPQFIRDVQALEMDIRRLLLGKDARTIGDVMREASRHLGAITLPKPVDVAKQAGSYLATSAKGAVVGGAAGFLLDLAHYLFWQSTDIMFGPWGFILGPLVAVALRARRARSNSQTVVDALGPNLAPNPGHEADG